MRRRTDAARFANASGCRAAPAEVDAALWLRVDSYSLLQALVYLAGRLAGEYEVKLVQLRLARAEGRARLDLVWSGPAMSTETVIGWKNGRRARRSGTGPLTMRDVVAEASCAKGGTWTC